ncbi:SAM-dependent methyltransferase [Nocardia tengchongensis]|uniref:SAM-dependent methyltransferase n=1 Tax=Nocardia tengchongensis TaxID=2055889 RepID=A0ABX8CJH2_9NOCA|nr:SAM-dependent methyltransferase [Nocardia tengchongensis]QVI19694.1 SAM-dependent methyltransferase [Nocardia tengchongensis]
MRARQSRPSVARVYSYVLGGRDNYGVDKDLGDYFIEDLPGSERLAFTNRDAVLRAAKAMAEAGIRQIIDMGCGLPTDENVHDVVRRVQPDARVVYVDDDPFVVAHGRALLAVDDGIAVLEADIRDPAGLEANAEVQRLIDFDEPVGLLFAMTLSFVNDEENPTSVIQHWADRIASGSRIYLSHFRTGTSREAVTTASKILEAFGRGRFRTDDEIRACFGTLPLDEDGVRPCAQWHTADGDGNQPELTVWEQLVVGGMAHKP